MMGRTMTTTASRPQALPVLPDAIPEVLRQLPRWVVWRYVEEADAETGEVDWDKPPVNARTGGLASSTNQATWSSLDVAITAMRNRQMDGLGIVLHRPKDQSGEGLVAIDLDKCRDPQTGVIETRATEIVQVVDSYTEISPSGCGLRIFLMGQLPPFGRKKGPYENYETAHYVTVTGHHVNGTPHTIESRQAELEQVHRGIFGDGKQTTNGAAHGPRTLTDLADAEIVRIASRAKGSGPKFSRLWSGDVSGFSSASEADLALCNYLAFWVGPDAERIADLFAQSGLARSKWQREDYRRRTIGKALEGRTEFYLPNGPKRTHAATVNGDGLQNGEPPEQQQHDDDSEKPNEALDDPHRLARLYLQSHQHRGRSTLRYWREEWQRWEGMCYRAVHDKEIRAELTRHAKEEFNRINLVAIRLWQSQQKEADSGKKAGPKPTARKVTTKLVGDLRQALASLALLPSIVATPAWIEGEAPCPAEEVLGTSNSLIHLPSFVHGEDCLFDPTPQFFSPNAVTYAFDANAASPTEWLRFLAQLWPDDAQAIGTLQEWFGYCLLPDTSLQKILMLIGPKRSGKGTVARVLRALVGLENVCAPTLASLGTNFGLWPLLEKSVAFIGDARLSGRTDAAVVVERLLSISGEDAQTVDRKHMTPVTTKLGVRFVILTNELPRLNDPSGALAGRMVLLRFVRSWFGEEDHHLTDRLLRELPGILLWAVEGWKRLRERGHFIQPESSRKLLDDLEDLSSPIGAFIREVCVVGPGYEVFVRDLFNHWKSWCEEKGRKDPGNEQSFGRDLRAAVPTLDVRQPRIGGKQVRVYVGIRLRPDGEEEGTPDCPFA
jgi:putative DNA primase/helicase